MFTNVLEVKGALSNYCNCTRIAYNCWTCQQGLSEGSSAANLHCCLLRSMEVRGKEQIISISLAAALCRTHIRDDLGRAHLQMLMND